MENIWSKISGGAIFAAGGDEPLAILRYLPPFGVDFTNLTSELSEEMAFATVIKR
jgi:hypothetical protein